MESKKIQLVTFRISVSELAAFDKTFTGERAEQLRKMCQERIKQYQASGNPAQSQSDDSEYENEKKVLRNSFAVSQKILNRIGDDRQIHNMTDKAVELCELPYKERHFEDIVAKAMVEPSLMRKLYGYRPVWDCTASSIDPLCWELFLQLIEEMIKQEGSKRKLTNMRFKKR